MANIESYLAQIRSAIYGEEVRGSIVNALEAQNNETENNTTTAEQALADAEVAIETANTAAANADSSGEEAVRIATEAAESAQNTADTAAASAEETASNAADEAVRIATEAANNAENTANTAADNANTAADNANTAAELANTAAENMISSYDITYQTSSIGTTAPTGEWTHSIPTVADGNYLWTKIEFTLLSGEVITAYSVAKNGGTSGEGGEGGNLWYGTCETAGDTAAKTVPCDGFEVDTGVEIVVHFFYTNTASNPTLNVNSTGAFPIYYKETAVEPGLLQSETTYMFVFAGDHYDVVGILETEIEEIPTSVIDSWFE